MTMPTKTNRLPSTPIRPPEPMHQALAVSLAAASNALDGDGARMPPEALPSGPRAGLTQRRETLRQALLPCGVQRALPILASLSGMAFRGEPDRSMMAAIAKQDVADVADLPEFALAGAVAAYRRGEIGEGKWRPTAGELRSEAIRRVDPHAAELARIARVLDAPLALAAPSATPEQRRRVLDGLRALSGRLDMRMAGIDPSRADARPEPPQARQTAFQRDG